MIAVGLTSVAGLYMVWVRGGSAGDLAQHVAISCNAVILTASAVLAWRAARSRDFSRHREWALRAYVAANGVYFFRLGVFLWIIVNQGPVGFDATTFRGPFLTALASLVYVVVPTVLPQLYFMAERHRGTWVPRLTAIALFVLAVLTGAGIASVSLIMWIPAL